MVDPDDQETYDNAISRRKMLAVAGASGVAALAGCGGDETTEPAAGTDTDEGPTVYDAEFHNAYAQNTADMHFNALASQNFGWTMQRLVHAPYLKYSFGEAEFMMGGLESIDVNLENQEATLVLRDDLTWSDGKDVTASEVGLQLDLMEKVGSSIWGYLSGWETDGDKTIILNLDGQVNPKILKFELGGIFIDTKEEVHGQWEDASEQDLLQWEWHGEDDPIASSAMFQFDNKDQQAAEFSRNPEFYKADNVNFEKYYLDSYGGNAQQHQALIGGQDIDAATSLFTPPETVEQFPDHVVEVNVPAKWGYGIVFNHDHEHFGKRNVRQAVAHVINRQQIVDNAGPRTKFPAEIPCGIAPRDQEYWLGDMYDSFNDYGVDAAQEEEATQLLEEAGYTKQGGTWQDGDGNTIGGDYYTPAGWTDWTTMTETVVDQLNSFGFDFTITSRPTNDWFGQFSESNFGMGAMYWLPGGARSAFPYFPLYHQLWEPEIGGGHNYRPIAESEQTIPGPDGGEMTLTPLDTVKNIATQPTDDDARPYVQDAAWHNHIDLPFISLVSKYEQSFTTNDDWTEAAQDSPNRRVKWPPFWWVHEGELQYRG